MKRGRHAAEDSSFGRSAGVNMVRGGVLIGLAVVIGLVLLRDVGSPSDVAIDPPAGTTPVETLPPEDITTTTARPAEEVRVFVANGTTTSGMAGRITDQVRPLGFTMLPAGDTTAAYKASRRNSVIYFADGFNDEALAIAQRLGLQGAVVQPMPTTGLPVSDLRGATILVVVGPDLVTQSAPAATTAPPNPGVTTTIRRL